MKLPAKLFATTLILGIAATYGCNGDDDDNGGTSTGARGGKGGTGGKGGATGSSGKGGTAGQGGTAGNGGSAGRGGTGGTGTAGGRGGTGGTSLAGEGGEGLVSGGGEGGSEAGNGGSAGVAQSPLVMRGDYLVNHVAACVDCHTPRNSDGKPDMARALAGNPTFTDLVPSDTAMGLIPTPNLTPDATGLAGWTDDQIKNAFLNGVDDDGAPLHPIMPYYVFHNMRDDDADAIVAYLRSVAPIANTIPERQPLPTPLTMPADPVPEHLIPVTTLASTNANYGRAQNGRYLAGLIGTCMECHTAAADSTSTVPIDTGRLFAGGRSFDAASLGLPVPPFPAQIVTPNLTPDATGSADLSVAEIAGAIRQGIDEHGDRLCPPMPAGPMEPFAGITPSDAEDIGIYLKSIAPLISPSYPACTPPEPGAGGAGGAGGSPG